jgi:hypothetical protein
MAKAVASRARQAALAISDFPNFATGLTLPLHWLRVLELNQLSQAYEACEVPFL